MGLLVTMLATFAGMSIRLPTREGGLSLPAAGAARYRLVMKRKRLKKGHSPALIDAAGHPRDATGHRTDVPATYSQTGQRLWRADELTYALGERVRATKAWHRMALGESGTIVIVEEFTQRDYLVLPDSLMQEFMRRHSGEFLSRMPEHYLEPE